MVKLIPARLLSLAIDSLRSRVLDIDDGEDKGSGEGVEMLATDSLGGDDARYDTETPSAVMVATTTLPLNVISLLEFETNVLVSSKSSNESVSISAAVGLVGVWRADRIGYCEHLLVDLKWVNKIARNYSAGINDIKLARGLEEVVVTVRSGNVIGLSRVRNRMVSHLFNLPRLRGNGLVSILWHFLQILRRYLAINYRMDDIYACLL